MNMSREPMYGSYHLVDSVFSVLSRESWEPHFYQAEPLTIDMASNNYAKSICVAYQTSGTLPDAYLCQLI